MVRGWSAAALTHPVHSGQLYPRLRRGHGCGRRWAPLSSEAHPALGRPPGVVHPHSPHLASLGRAPSCWRALFSPTSAAGVGGRVPAALRQAHSGYSPFSKRWYIGSHNGNLLRFYEAFYICYILTNFIYYSV